MDNENEKKEACSCPEGIRSPASQSNPYDRGDGDGDVDEGENANEESAQSEAAGTTMMERPLTLSLSKMYRRPN